jgi:hypothetical protein
VNNAPGNFQMLLDIPGNVTATVMLPAHGLTNPVALVDDRICSGAISNDWLILQNVRAGEHTISLNMSRDFYSKHPVGSSTTNMASSVMAEPSRAGRAGNGAASD